MDGIETPARDIPDPWIPHCNSKGRDPGAIDPMPATVTLYVYGLGVWFFKNNAQRAVMNFLREETHELSIRVIEKNSEGGLVGDDTVQVPTTSNVIFIAGDKPARITTELNERMPFDRYNWQWNDPEDLRWLVDMTNDIHGGVPVMPIPNEKVLTPLWVHNALFYTKSYTDYNMDVTDASGTAVVNDHFGAVGAVVGAKIEADSVRIYLADVIDRTLLKVPNFSHEVHIFNQGSDQTPDFYKYYWIMGEKSPIPRQFDLKAVGMNTMSNDIVCNSIRGEGDPGEG